MDITDKVSPDDVFRRIHNLAVFVRSVLHLPFIELDGVNPSFAVIAKYCELAVLVLKDEAHTGAEHVEYLTESMQHIAIAVVDRDDKSLIDCMAMLDEFLEQHRAI